MRALFGPDVKMQIFRQRLQVATIATMILSSAARPSSIVQADVINPAQHDRAQCVLWKDCTFYIHRPAVAGQPSDLCCQVTTVAGKTAESRGRQFGVFANRIPVFNGPFLMFTQAVMDGYIRPGQANLRTLLDPAIWEGLPASKKLIRIPVNKEKGDMPLCRAAKSIDGKLVLSDTIPWTTGVSASHLEDASRASGSGHVMRWYVIRRMCCLSMMSANSRLPMIQHAMMHTIGGNMINFYMPMLTQIDIQGLLFGTATRDDLIGQMNTLRMQPNPNARLWLSVGDRQKCLDEPQVKAALEMQIQLGLKMKEMYGTIDKPPAQSSLVASWEADHRRYRQLYKLFENAYNRCHRYYFDLQWQKDYEQSITLGGDAAILDDPQRAKNKARLGAIDRARDADAAGESISVFDLAVEGVDFDETNVVVDTLFGNADLLKGATAANRETLLGSLADAFIPSSEPASAAPNAASVTMKDADDAGDLDDLNGGRIHTVEIADLPDDLQNQQAESVVRASTVDIPAPAQAPGRLPRSKQQFMLPEKSQQQDLPPANLFDRLSVALFEESDPYDQIATFELLLQMPATHQAIQGYYPGQAPIMPDETCVSCHEPLPAIVNELKGQALIRKKVEHAFACGWNAAVAKDLPALVEYFEAAAKAMAEDGYDCLACEKVNHSLTLCGRRAYQHVSRHMTALRKIGEYFMCRLCKQQVRATMPAVILHSALKHATWLISASVADCIDGKLLLHHFGGLPIRYDLETSSYITSVVEWERLMKHRLEIIQDLKARRGAIGSRNDINWDLLGTGSENQPNTLPALTYKAVEILTDMAVAQYGRCPICMWNDLLTFTERMVGLSVRKWKVHIKDELKKLYKQGRDELVAKYREQLTDAQNSPIATAPLGQGWAPLRLPAEAQGQHSCNDPQCVRFNLCQEVALFDFANHLVRFHAIDIKPLPANTTATSSGYIHPAHHIFVTEFEMLQFFEGIIEKAASRKKDVAKEGDQLERQSRQSRKTVPKVGAASKCTTGRASASANRLEKKAYIDLDAEDDVSEEEQTARITIVRAPVSRKRKLVASSDLDLPLSVASTSDKPKRTVGNGSGEKVAGPVMSSQAQQVVKDRGSVGEQNDEKAVDRAAPLPDIRDRPEKIKPSRSAATTASLRDNSDPTTVPGDGSDFDELASDDADTPLGLDLRRDLPIIPSSSRTRRCGANSVIYNSDVYDEDAAELAFLTEHTRPIAVPPTGRHSKPEPPVNAAAGPSGYNGGDTPIAGRRINRDSLLTRSNRTAVTPPRKPLQEALSPKQGGTPTTRQLSTGRSRMIDSPVLWMSDSEEEK